MKKVLAGWFVMMLVLGCVCNQNTFVYGAEFGVKIGTQRLESGSGKTKLSLDVRFNIGLTKMARVSSSYTLRNHSLSFSVGLSF